MNCDDLRPPDSERIFSDRLDGALDDDARARFDAHVGGCADCARAWREFQRATGALQSLGVPPLEAGYVDAVVGAALAAAPTTTSTAPLRWPRVASHAAALLLGAALFGAYASRRPAPEPEVREVVRTVVQEVPIPGPTPEPEVRIEWRERTIVETAYVDREVEVVREVERPVEVFVRDRSFEGTLATVGANLAAWGDAVAKLEPTVDEPEPAADDDGWVRELTRSDVPPRPVTAEPTRDATLVVRREEDRVSLSTRGSLEEIVPALIARLDDDDPAVRQAVEGRLLEIQAQLGGGEVAALATPEDEGFGPIGWRRWWPDATDETDEESSSTELWSAWWQRTSEGREL